MPGNHWKIFKTQMFILRNNASIEKITYIPERVFLSWSLQLLQLCFIYLISPLFHLSLFWNNQILLSVVRVVQEHTQLIYLGETNNIAQPAQGMSRPSALFYLFPQYLTNSYPPWEIKMHSKKYCSLGQYATVFSELHICQKLCRCCLSFIPTSRFPVSLQNDSILPFPPCLH